MGRGNSDEADSLPAIERRSLDNLDDLHNTLVEELNRLALSFAETGIPGDDVEALEQWERLFPEQSWVYLKESAPPYLVTATGIRLKQIYGEGALGQAARLMRVACLLADHESYDESESEFVRAIANTFLPRITSGLDEIVPGQLANRFLNRVDDGFYIHVNAEATRRYRKIAADSAAFQTFFDQVYSGSYSLLGNHVARALEESDGQAPDAMDFHRAIDNALSFEIERNDALLRTFFVTYLTSYCWPQAAQDYWIGVELGKIQLDDDQKWEFDRMRQVWMNSREINRAVSDALKAAKPA